MSKVELITNESGDWSVLKKDDKIVFQDHSIPDYIWLALIASFNVETFENTISDEDMEENYS